MKKKLLPLILGLVCAIACAFGLAACNNDNSDRAQHSPSTQLDFDNSGHWYRCTVSGCKEQWDWAPHNNKNDCTCGYVYFEPTDEHVWSQEWTTNQSSHWHECTVEGCQQIKAWDLHSLVNGSCVCGQGLLYFELNADEESYKVKDITGRQYPAEEITVSEITIPTTYKGKPVTVIGEQALAHCTGITSITIPDSITSIEREAFTCCTSLKSVTIPDSVTSMDWAFSDCPIESAIVPARLAGYIAHSSDLTFQTVVITSGDKIESNTFNSCSALTSVTIPDSVTSIEGGAFYGCDSLESISIPDGVTSIGYGAFQFCSSLASITIPNGVTVIENYTFNSCTSLASIVIPNRVTSIGESAFNGCTSLASITVPDTVANIGRDAFAGTAWLDNQSDGVLYIGKVAYKYNGEKSDLTSVVIREGTKSIAPSAFHSCEELANVTLPDGLLNIGVGAFSGCKITDIAIPDSVESIGSSAFYNTPWYRDQPDGLIYIGKVAYEFKGSLTNTYSITIQDGTKGISDYAFHGCQNLQDLTIPDSVTNIGEYAFAGCNSLARLYMGTGVTSIGYAAFQGCSRLTSVRIPTMAIEHIVGAATGLGAGFAQTVGDVLERVEIIGGDRIPDNAFKDCTDLKILEIGDSVTSIGNHAFEGCIRLYNYLDIRNFQISHIKLGNGVTSIGDYAFNGCTGLEQLEIPDSVTFIGNGAFDGCHSLAYISVGAANLNYSSQDGILYNKEKTEILLIPKCVGENTNGKITIPAGIRRIGQDMFRDCNKIKEITFEANIEGIGAHAFDGCTKLERITFNGTIIQWRTFSKGEGWNDNTGDYTVICNDGSLIKSDS